MEYDGTASAVSIHWDSEYGPDFRIGTHCSVGFVHDFEGYRDNNVDTQAQAEVLTRTLLIYLHELYLEFSRLEDGLKQEESPRLGYETVDIEIGSGIKRTRRR